MSGTGVIAFSHQNEASLSQVWVCSVVERQLHSSKAELCREETYGKSCPGDRKVHDQMRAELGMGSFRPCPPVSRG
jgi:hypothetical protein